MFSVFFWERPRRRRSGRRHLGPRRQRPVGRDLAWASSPTASTAPAGTAWSATSSSSKYGSDGVRGLFYRRRLAACAPSCSTPPWSLVFGFVMAYVWFKLSNLITPIRVSRETEMQGLDGPEMAPWAIPTSPSPVGTNVAQLKRPLSVPERPRPRWPRPLLLERVVDWRPAGSRNTDLGPAGTHPSSPRACCFSCHL